MNRRILILTEIISPYRIPVFNALAKIAGVELHVVFLSETDSTLRQWLVYKSEIQFSYEVLPSWRRRIRRYHVLLNWGLWSALRSRRPSVIICGGYNYLASWQAGLWARIHGVPFVLWCESNLNDRRKGHVPIEFLKRLFLKGCDGFVVPGTASFAYLRAFGVPEGTISIAPNAVDNDLFARAADVARRNGAALRRSLSLPPRYFLYVGRLVREKGVFDLLEAYARLEDKLRSEVGLVLVGDGPAMPELLERGARIAPGEVRCAGFVQRDALSSYYALAEALVFPTLSDPWGLVVNEAMACGLPVIGSRAAGCVPDLVCDQWNGYVISPGDIQGLAWAMASLARQAELVKTMGARSADRVFRNSPAACASGLAAAAARVSRRLDACTNTTQ